MDRLSSARGNTSLETAVSLTKQLRWEIQQLGQRLSTAASAEELFQRRSSKAQEKAQHAQELKQIAQAIRKLLIRLEDAVPLINLAITASGASLSSSLPTTVSPSRLLQASTFLTAGDSQYASSTTGYVQIGPTFTLSMYMLFQGHIRPQDEDDVRESTWKEVIHKAVVRLMRVPIDALYVMPGTHGISDSIPEQGSPAQNGQYFPTQITSGPKIDEYAYQLVIVEDLNDDRVHTFEDGEAQPAPYGDIGLAGIQEAVPIHELSKIFYADTGKILNIGSEGEANSPVLLLKRDPNAIPPRRIMDRYADDNDLRYTENGPNSIPQSPAINDRQDSKSMAVPPQRGHRSASVVSNLAQHQLRHAPDPWRLPPDLDPEWMAFEVYTETEDSDTEPEADNTPSPNPSRPSRTSSHEPSMTSALSRLNLGTPTASSPSQQPTMSDQQRDYGPSLPSIRTSLSLLETLLRLLALQQFQQTPHLSIPDELLTFFLSESASTGAASNDVQERKRVREEARRRVGFDPYDESPIKRRGEEYQHRNSEVEGWDARSQSFTDEQYGSLIPEGYEGRRYEDEGYDTRDVSSPGNGPPPSTPRRATSDTPERRFRNQPGSAMSISTGQSPSPAGRPPPLTRRSDGGRYGLRGTATAAGRRGSPLARPGTGLTDEGLGMSPTAMAGEETKSS